VERGKIGKDGKEREVQGDEMERREQKGENGQVMGDDGTGLGSMEGQQCV